MRAHFAFRIRITLVLIVLCALVLIGRLYMVQIVEGDDFALRADRQYTNPTTALYDRGSIFFKDRLVSAATLASGFVVAINPSILEDPEAAYDALLPLLSIDRELFLARAGKENDPYEEVARRVPSDIAEKIALLDIDGLDVYKEQWRFYPGGESAASTIGFVGYQGDELAGRYGLERYYNDVLERDGGGVYVNFFAEVFANIGSVIFSSANMSGDIETSLEPSVQFALEQHLEEVALSWNAQQSGGIIIDPFSGEIYALGVYPSFDLNAFAKAEDPGRFRNPLVEDVFEMGSIIKPLTLAAGLDTGVVTADTTYIDTGFVTLNNATISNYDGKGRGRVSMQEVLNQSLNTGAVFVEQKIGNERFRDYFLAYGFGEETGIDLPNESAGIVKNLQSPRDLEYATASFGQGIATTPIATVRALSTLANGGTLVTPHVATHIRYESGLSRTVSFPEGTRVISKNTSEEITRMLVAVVDDALLGGTVAKERYSIAAKTGTAQIAKPEGGGYYEDRYLHLFFGYFPAYEPRFLIFLYVREPKGVRYASQTLTHPFMDIVQFLINHYEVSPDR